ncbi:helix-turn-helix transcriptional regulator [Lentzea sp. HUAS12]|uniref:helix-turn-helix transcriptional regulator n=1 Tax=Lentzea sp. HUAS12 TaxID=2951806 RepID=UPI00209EC211|nr:helix-turn-helix transcriptional regulator [Lentzea sp. HUAS12]USX52896.1 helix-turn-helix transcriptional regulator [Lentzea sp. HUAS12]
MPRQELARFLRDRRDALRPPETGADRRTPGLRREEVAALAHMSVDYYTRLEQARGPRPSPTILEGLSRALGLTRAERSHLFRLAGALAPPSGTAASDVRPHVAGMLERLPATAAIVTNAAYDVVAWNPLAGTVLGCVGGTNLARRRFLGEGHAYESSSAEEFGHVLVARLRRSADRYPHDERLAGLLADLHAGSEEFRRIWRTRPVHAPGHRAKTVQHPEAGTLHLNCDVLLVPEDDQEVVLVTADPGTRSAQALDRLTREARPPGSRGTGGPRSASSPPARTGPRP